MIPATKIEIFAFQLNQHGVPPDAATEAATILASGQLVTTPEQLALLERCLSTIRTHDPRTNRALTAH